jgi:transcriptional regulator with XRE-family HTH domain
MNKNNEIKAESLAVRIKRLRIANGFTQKQLGELIGTSATAVGKWEAGVYVPKGRYVAKLAGALGIDAAALLGDTPISLDELAEEVQLLKAFRSLPEERQLIAIKLVEALKLTDN